MPRSTVEPARESTAERTMELRRREEATAPAAAGDDFDTATFDPVEIDLDLDDDPTDAAGDNGVEDTAADVPDEADGDTDDTEDTDDGSAAASEPVPTAAEQPERPVATPATALEHRTAMVDNDDPAQQFVSRLRAAAAGFAAAAGAESAVVREAVPPARHRRSRCRLVLRYAGGGEADLTFLGSVGRPGTPAWLGFDLQIQQWLGNGQHREAAWLVEDPEAPDGVAVDVPAWLAAG